MKKQGKLSLAKHLIGDRRPIVAFIGVSALAGCGESLDYTLYTKMMTCSTNIGAEDCQARYQQAVEEANRTAMKYMTERDCQQDYGDSCTEYNDIWRPKVAGFIVHKSKTNFSLPFFTSTNPLSSHFGYAIIADGNVLGQYRDANGKKVALSGKYTRPLPDSVVEPMGTGETTTVNTKPSTTNNNSNNSGGSSFVRDIATAYVVSELIDETGDYLSEREKTKRYQQCMDQGGKNCSSRYKVTSGTARTNSSSTTSSSYKKKSKLNNKQVSSYKSSPKVTTISSGGFGNTGSLRGGFGG